MKGGLLCLVRSYYSDSLEHEWLFFLIEMHTAVSPMPIIVPDTQKGTKK